MDKACEGLFARILWSLSEQLCFRAVCILCKLYCINLYKDIFYLYALNHFSEFCVYACSALEISPRLNGSQLAKLKKDVPLMLLPNV